MKAIYNNICLIGGTGYLGTSFRRIYNSQFSKFLILGRKEEAVIFYENEKYVSLANLEINEVVDLLREEEIKFVIDFAYNSIPKTSFENPIDDFSENLLLVNRHLEVVKKLKGCRYIYISSGGTVYGNVDPYPIDEMQQNFPVSPYGITKMACERYVKMYHHLYDMDVVIVRPSNLYGPGQKPFSGQGFIATAMGSAHISESINVYGDGSTVRDYLYIEDFCAGLLDVIIYGSNGEIYNIGSSSGKSLSEILSFISKMVEKLDKHLKISYFPERRFDVQYNVLNNSKISRLNNWKVDTDLQSGLTKTWNWLLEYMG